MKKKVLVALLALIVIGAIVTYKMLYRPHREIASEAVLFSTTASEIKQQFLADPSVANARYADKTIIVTGQLTLHDSVTNTIVIDSILSAVLEDVAQKPTAIGSSIRVKGRFVGYDDLLEELKMDQASILNPEDK